MSKPHTNRLYFGDCLDVMQEYLPDNSIDLIYLDPPFNSKRIYNAFIGGAQWVAFDDTWRWYEAVDDFDRVARLPDMAGTMEGLRWMLDESPRMAYLSYMAARLLECKRILKDTGSIYLHCDPTMSHYLKTVMDGVFGHINFRNEIIWHYQTGGAGKRWFARKHDVIFLYTKSSGYEFYPDRVLVPRTDEVIRRIKSGVKNATRAKTLYKLPMDVGTDIPALNAMDRERLGYPTQKPLKLLRRIIEASSNENGIVFDPFCGCGTTIHAAQELKRHWIGIDVCVTACEVIRDRLTTHFDSLWSDIDFVGLPIHMDDARSLAEYDPFKFEKWAASIVRGMEANKRQRGDKGIDGRGRLPIAKGKFLDVVSQVKAGSATRGHIQAFDGARREARADLGVFTCFDDKVTEGMRNAAATFGKHDDRWPVIQIFTIEDYFAGRQPDLPIAS